jgi:hypothetical protein
MAITPLPPAPLVTDDTATFNTKAFAWVNAIDGFTTEANSTASQVNADAGTATSQAGIATTKAGEASASADLAEDWATKTDGEVAGGEFSAKKYAQDSSDSADAAAASAVEAAGLVENYQGALASDPALNKDGGALVAGDWYVNTVSGLIRAYDGAAWVTSVNVTAGVSSFSAGSTGLTPSTGTQGDVTLAGTLGVSNGGTGLTSPGTAGNILTSDGTNWTSAAPAPSAGTLEAIASGSLFDGSTVVVNTDGTVSVVQLNDVDPPLVAGTSYTMPKTNINNMATIYDTFNKKIVIIFEDQANNEYGTAVVGTVSGDVITFGTAVVFSSSFTNAIGASYNSTAQKIVISYQNDGNSGAGTAIVGTVSGTSISFGTPQVYNSNPCPDISVAYDSVNDKSVIVYRDFSNSNAGTAVVASVSGTSISFGTPVLFSSNNCQQMSAVYDSNSQKIVIFYKDLSDGNIGKSIVGIVSGTSISFGTPVTFSSSATDFISASYDVNAQKILIAYRGAALASLAIVGTVSGTSISFGTSSVFGNVEPTGISTTYDSIAKKIIISYADGANSQRGTFVVASISGTSLSFGTNTLFRSTGISFSKAIYVPDQYRTIIVSSGGVVVAVLNVDSNFNSYIGISNDSYSDGETATIQIVGSVDDAQSGLTPGQSYYLQFDGSLGTTPDVPEVFAGTAVSANKLIVKG